MISQVHNFTFWLIFGLSLNLGLGEKLIQIPKSEMTHLNAAMIDLVKSQSSR